MANIVEGLSVSEACHIAGVGRTKIYEALANGSLIGRKFGKRRLILRSELMDFLKNLPIIKPEEISNLNDAYPEE